MTAAERLVSLAGTAGTAATLLLLIGSGATAGDALVNYSGLASATAAEHLLVEKAQEQTGGGPVSLPARERNEEFTADTVIREIEASAPSVSSSVSEIHVPPMVADHFDLAALGVLPGSTDVTDVAPVVVPVAEIEIAVSIEVAQEASITDAYQAQIRDDEVIALILAIVETL